MLCIMGSITSSNTINRVELMQLVEKSIVHGGFMPLLMLQIKIFYLTHVCSNPYKNTKYDVKYLVCTYKSSFKNDPTWILYALQQRVKRDCNIDVPIAHCYRTKEALLQLLGCTIVLQGDMQWHYDLPILVVVLILSEIEHSSNECIFASMLVKRASSMVEVPSLV